MTAEKVFRCPHCQTAIYVRKEGEKSLIKSRLVFTDAKGQILAKCKECRQIVALPIRATAWDDL